MTPARMDRIEAGLRTVIAFIEAVNRHDIHAMMALVSEDCRFESAAPAPDGSTFSGKPAITEYFQRMFTQAPQAHVKVEEAFGLGYRCIVRWRLDWPAGGTTETMHGADIYRVQDGLICEILSYVKG